MIYFNQWVGDCLDTSVDESLEDFKGDTQQRYMTIALRVPQWLLWLKIATTSALLQIFGILSWRMQELRKSRNQDLRADLAWSIIYMNNDNNINFSVSIIHHPISKQSTSKYLGVILG